MINNSRSKRLPVKLPSFKNDLAPMGFYFDIIPTSLFQIPILTVPSRIDKITNGQATFFILPNFCQIRRLSRKLNLSITFEFFFIEGLKNIIKYAKEKYKEITFRELSIKKLKQWFEKSISIQASIPTLKRDFSFLILKFLKLYQVIYQEPEITEEKYKQKLIEFCNLIINYFEKRILANRIKIHHKGHIRKESLYTKIEDDLYPRKVNLSVKNLKNNRTKQMSFVPYLIYDDLLNIFIYNKSKLIQKDYKFPKIKELYKRIININTNANIIEKHKNKNNFIENIKIEELL